MSIKKNIIEESSNSIFASEEKASISIIGGGLAGLSLSILLANAGYHVILFEKEKYPFHKVCGEYISMESWGFIEKLGLPLCQLSLPKINKLIVSSTGGKVLKSELGLGGFGISRYFLDNELKEIALKAGVIIKEQTKVLDVIFREGLFTVKYNGGEMTSSIVAGCFGKRSNLDIKWQRDFIRQKQGKLINYIGVKYHVKIDLPDDTIALHNFKDGYCGISKVENGKYCLCYLTTAKNLKDNNNSIEELEKNVLCQNPFLKKIFTEAKFLFAEPATISQIRFNKKSQVEGHILMTGDAAGMISPLCGNGMSMALHSAKIAFENIDLFLKQNISRVQMESNYAREWELHFGARLKAGRIFQKLFGKVLLTQIFISLMKRFSFVVHKMINATHGKEF